MNEISLCMIVKNEKTNLEHCLSRISEYVDEIVIVDTGSTDTTKEIALKYTDKVYDFQWRNDFAAARNYAISKTNYEFILSLDADEFLEEINISEMKHMIKTHPVMIGRILVMNEYTRKDNTYRYKERISRLFSKQYYHYEGRIHEQITPLNKNDSNKIMENNNLPTLDIPLTILHTGYEGDLETRKKKTERNIHLLLNAHEANPDDPYILYQLGKSYYMAEDYPCACDYFGQALYFDLDPKLEYVQDMVESYGYALINTEQYETALQLIGVYDEFAHSADFIFVIALILMNNGRFKEAISEFQKAAAKADSKMEGVNGYLAYYNIGVIYECMGNNLEAKKYYRKCGDYEAALQRLSSIR